MIIEPLIFACMTLLRVFKRNNGKWLRASVDVLATDRKAPIPIVHLCLTSGNSDSMVEE